LTALAPPAYTLSACVRSATVAVGRLAYESGRRMRRMACSDPLAAATQHVLNRLSATTGVAPIVATLFGRYRLRHLSVWSDRQRRPRRRPAVYHRLTFVAGGLAISWKPAANDRPSSTHSLYVETFSSERCSGCQFTSFPLTVAFCQRKRQRR